MSEYSPKCVRELLKIVDEALAVEPGPWHYGSFGAGLLLTGATNDKHNYIANFGEWQVPWDSTESSKHATLCGHAASIVPELAAQAAAMMAELEALKKKPPTKGDPKIDAILGTPDPAFRAWVDALPVAYWARYDVSACRVGWHYGREELRSQPAESAIQGEVQLDGVTVLQTEKVHGLRAGDVFRFMIDAETLRPFMRRLEAAELPAEPDDNYMQPVELAHRCLRAAIAGSSGNLTTVGEIRKAIITLFGERVESELAGKIIAGMKA